MIAPRIPMAAPVSARAIEHGAYRPGSDNACPACAGHQWHVGRITAECAQCGEILMLASPSHHYRTGVSQ